MRDERVKVEVETFQLFSPFLPSPGFIMQVLSHAQIVSLSLTKTNKYQQLLCPKPHASRAFL